jgi:hypothetical protein
MVIKYGIVIFIERGIMKLTSKELIKFSLALASSSMRSRIWQIVKLHVKKRGHWKNKPRGNPGKGYQSKND